MTLALEYIWVLPVMIGVAATYFFAMQDLAPKAATVQQPAKTKDE